MREKFARLRKRFPDEVGLALYQETQIELTEVKKRTPVDTGNLRASEHVEGPIRDGRTIYTLIVAGGPSAPYAIFVHEDPDAFHKVGQWKFIESVIMESAPHMAARVAKRIDLNRALEG
jgi:hypothetical protein